MNKQQNPTWKCLLAQFALLVSLVEVSADVLVVGSFRAQFDVAQFTFKQLSVVLLMHVVLVLLQAIGIRGGKVTLVTDIRLDHRVT